MTTATKQIITAAIAGDATATDAERAAVLAALDGQEQIVRPKEACAMLGVSRATLFRMCDAGKLKRRARFRKNGITKSSIDAVLSGAVA